MYTSYYASKKLEHGMNLVGISQSIPPFVKQNINIYKPLAPSWGLVSEFKKCMITETQYERKYYATVLNRLNPEEVYQELGADAVLLCWEAPGKFCHRHIVARWLNKALNLNITEL